MRPFTIGTFTMGPILTDKQLPRTCRRKRQLGWGIPDEELILHPASPIQAVFCAFKFMATVCQSIKSFRMRPKNTNI